MLLCTPGPSRPLPSHQIVTRPPWIPPLELSINEQASMYLYIFFLFLLVFQWPLGVGWHWSAFPAVLASARRVRRSSASSSPAWVTFKNFSSSFIDLFYVLLVGGPTAFSEEGGARSVPGGLWQRCPERLQAHPRARPYALWRPSISWTDLILFLISFHIIIGDLLFVRIWAQFEGSSMSAASFCPIRARTSLPPHQSSHSSLSIFCWWNFFLYKLLD